MNDLITQFISLVDGVKLIVLFGLIALDTLTGIFLSITNKTFSLTKIADFLNTSILGLVIGYYAIGIFATIKPEFAFAVPLTWAMIDAKLIADVIAKLRKIGVPA